MTENRGSSSFVYFDGLEELDELGNFELVCDSHSSKPLIWSLPAVPLLGRRELCGTESGSEPFPVV